MPECKFGAKCYRKNEDHLRECHPEKISKENADSPKESPQTATEKVPLKRKMNLLMDEEVVKEKKGAKMRRGNEGDKKDDTVAKELTEVFEENETVEDIANAERKSDEDSFDSSRSPSKCPPSPSRYPHRSPFSPQPQSLYTIWRKALLFEPDNPRDAFSEVDGMRLVGYFDYLAGDLRDATDDEIRLHARYATDLPEMQTIMITQTGRYALWRDDPKSATVMVVFVKHGDDHFTKITMVGDKPIHAIIHAAGEDAENVLKKFYPPSEFQYATIGRVKHDAKTAITKRTKISLGRPVHSMRLWVHVDANSVGYRSLGEDLNKLKKTMGLIGETTDEVVRKKKMAELREIGTNVQLAMDECDFGTGLEWGHDLFIANFPQLDAMAKRCLIMAYQLLNRDEFAAIIEAQMEEGVRRRDKVLIN
ncbi:hypothetical protein PRIPAC_79470 [Pristionchus pacificus]|uniref:PBZ-type domain-containing protein n=1 Tax=Pristionchus pacificus TaxID=54126 RepID=A0A8R1V5C9_PRIPA|nr:hypothetical protein PRIPAC_79470 [Pristionchus pacificus]